MAEVIMAAAGVEDPEVAVMAAREVVATVAEPRSEAVAMAVAPASGAAIVVMGPVQEPDALVATTGLECEAVAAMPTTGDQEFAAPTSIEAIGKAEAIGRMAISAVTLAETMIATDETSIAIGFGGMVRGSGSMVPTSMPMETTAGGCCGAPKLRAALTGGAAMRRASTNDG